MKKILIITYSNDNECVENVSKFIEERGAEAIRMNVDQYPLDIALTSSFENSEWKSFLELEDKRIDISELEALWFRRAYNIGRGIDEVLEKKFVSPTIGEVSQTLFGMIEGMDCYCLGSMSLYRRMDSKEEQLKIAHQLGLNIPKTCITNNPEDAKKFVTGCSRGAIVKMQSGFAIYEDGEEHVVFTNVITDNNFDTIDTLKYCPMQFQEKIEKKVELRATVVGDKIFTFEIDSQKEQHAKVDWRKEGVKMIKDWKKHTLPADIETRLLQLMDYFGHDYGAIDLILTPEGTYYFLEVNAAGEFFWLDLLCDHRISAQIADLLTGNVKRRYGKRNAPAHL